MRIRVRGYLTLKEVLGDQIWREIEGENVTIRDLVRQLSLEIDDPAHLIYDPEIQGPSRHVAVLVNGRHYSHLPDRLDTELKPGDEVAIFPPTAGG